MENIEGKETKAEVDKYEKGLQVNFLHSEDDVECREACTALTCS